jgi:S-formylglutathione hydrolase
MPALEKVSSNRVSNGILTKYTFPSRSVSLKTTINVFVPSSASPTTPVPVMFFLAGLTCNEDTGCQKGGFLVTAGEEEVAVVCPDTSPRGAGVEGEEEEGDLGTGGSSSHLKLVFSVPMCEELLAWG